MKKTNNCELETEIWRQTADSYFYYIIAGYTYIQ